MLTLLAHLLVCATMATLVCGASPPKIITTASITPTTCPADTSALCSITITGTNLGAVHSVCLTYTNRFEQSTDVATVVHNVTSSFILVTVRYVPTIPTGTALTVKLRTSGTSDRVASNTSGGTNTLSFIQVAPPVGAFDLKVTSVDHDVTMYYSPVYLTITGTWLTSVPLTVTLITQENNINGYKHIINVTLDVGKFHSNSTTVPVNIRGVTSTGAVGVPYYVSVSQALSTYTCTSCTVRFHPYTKSITTSICIPESCTVTFHGYGYPLKAWGTSYATVFLFNLTQIATKWNLTLSRNDTTTMQALVRVPAGTYYIGYTINEDVLVRYADSTFTVLPSTLSPLP